MAPSVQYVKLKIPFSNHFISDTSSNHLYQLQNDQELSGGEIFSLSWICEQGHGKLKGKI